MLFTAFRPAVTLAPASAARRPTVAQDDNHHDNHAQADADPRNDANQIERPVGSWGHAGRGEQAAVVRHTDGGKGDGAGGFLRLGRSL